jgi:mono/diheme cytochrome c family protein
MRNRHSFFSCAALLLATLLLASCGGSSPGDVFPMSATAVSPTSGPDSFLLFPNPQKQQDGTLQTNTTAYATAYYAAIDPNNAEDTLDKWKAVNGFGNLATGTEVTVVVGDQKDLGYGRRITARNITSGPNAGTIAVMVENYLVAPAAYYTYSSLNLDAAVVQDSRWHVGTNAIEFSASACTPSDSNIASAICDSLIRFAKFYTFNPTTGQRLLAADLDGRGDKAMPGICITCHGGRGDPLTPATGSPTSLALFPWVGNSASAKRGDVQAHLQPLIVDSFGYSTTPGYTRADQEASLKTINEWVLSSYPITSVPSCISTTCPEDANRRVANGLEWNGTAANIIKAAYGGDGLPNATFSDTYLPTGWQAATYSNSATGAAAENLYKTVVAPYCRTCHIQRGSNAFGMDDLNFDNYCSWNGSACDPTAQYSYFYGYATRIKAHVIDRGNMPLAKIVYERFWDSSDPPTLANFLQGAQTQAVFDANHAVLKPGRPVAVPGPDRTTDSPATLSAANSLYATTYNWSIVSGSGGSLGSPNSVQTTLTGTVGATYGVQLVVGNGTTQSAPVTVNITIDTAGSAALPIAAANIHFTDIKGILQGSGSCIGCHYPGGGPPIFYTDIDRNNSGGYDATDDLWFWTELRGRINFTDVAASPLLRKPTGHHHGGGVMLAANGPSYNMFLLWILNGAPY